MQRIFVLMFHRIFDPLQVNNIHRFEHFLKNLSQNYEIVFPNETVQSRKPIICLTFDDAYYDFYHYVFPLLQKYDLKAVLAVPVKTIQESTLLSTDTRLTAPDDASHAFCTWQELIEMADSPNVMIASHGYEHADLTHPDTNLETEITLSKSLLENRLQKTISTFVYPYGRMNGDIHNKVRQHYQHGLRIGNAFNFRWNTTDKLIYRIDADPFWKRDKKLLSFPSQLKLLLKYCSNRLRSR